MNIRPLLLGIMGAALLSTAALAAANPNNQNHPANKQQMADRCAALESQYENTIAHHQGAAGLDRAEGLGSIGTEQCHSNQGDIGVQKLDQALNDLGVRPVD
jgi:hypothetical protein